MKKLLWLIIFTATVLKLFFFIYINKNCFLRSFDPNYFSKLYSGSQYVIGEFSKRRIGDDGLYAFAGYYYLFQRGDVTDVNFEHPPLGKYLIGLSIFLFKNENVINIIYFVILLILTYKIGKIILKEKIFAILACFILSLDPLFNDHLLRSLIDLPFTVFFISAVYFFLLSLRNSKYLHLSFIFWGMSFSTKFFPFFVFLYIFLLTVFFFYKRNKLSIFFITSLWIPIIYSISHISFFFYHPSVVVFIRHKKWMLSWFTGAPKIFGNLIRNIYTATYFDSNNDFVLRKNEHWTSVLPTIVALSLLSFRSNFIKKRNLNTFVIYGLFILYFTYAIFFTTGLIKYIMPVYPFMVILAVDNVVNIYSIITSWRKRSLSKSKAKL